MKNQYLVSWIKWDRTSPQWRPIYKFQRSSTLDKANRLKQNLLKQTRFIEVTVSKTI